MNTQVLKKFNCGCGTRFTRQHALTNHFDKMHGGHPPPFSSEKRSVGRPKRDNYNCSPCRKIYKTR